jgi:hypothetical protein
MNMIQVDVTDKDIQCGVKRNIKKCPVALAMLRTLNLIVPNHYEVLIGNYVFRVVDDHKIYKFPTPQIVIKFIIDFDCDELVSPIRFDFDMDKGKLTDRTNFGHLFYPYHLEYKKIWIEGSWDSMNISTTKVQLSEDVKKFHILKEAPSPKLVLTDDKIVEPTKAELDKFMEKYFTDPALALVTI